MKAWILSLLVLCAFGSFGYAEESDKELRITELLPGLLNPLAVEPALPKDFIALSPDQEQPDLHKGVFWGPKETLTAYFKDPASLERAIIAVKLSEKGEESLEKMGIKNFSEKFLSWGPYPVYSMHMDFADQFHESLQQTKEYSAWIGLNTREGWTLHARLVYPQKLGHPALQDLEIWNNFLEKTKPLSERQAYKARGQDLKLGSTTVTVDGAKVVVIAERRSSDDKLQIVAIPLDENVDFQVKGAVQGLMGATWHHGDPVAKVAATIIKKDTENHLVMDMVVSVLIKPVSKFSLDAKEMKRKEGICVYEM